MPRMMYAVLIAEVTHRVCRLNEAPTQIDTLFRCRSGLSPDGS